MSDKKAKLKDMPEIIKNMIYRQLEAHKLKLRSLKLDVVEDDVTQYLSMAQIMCGTEEIYKEKYQCWRFMLTISGNRKNLFAVSFNKKTIYPALIHVYGDVDYYTFQIDNFLKLKNMIIFALFKKLFEAEYLSGIDLWRDAIY